jgi:hypothetical protein
MVNRVKKSGRWTGANSAGSQTLLGKSLSRAVNDRAKTAVYQSYAVGGVVKRTGLAKVHKNEIVIPAKTAKMLKRIMKK